MIKNLISPLTDDELKTAFSEIQEWQRTGVLAQGVVRDIHRKYIEKVGYNDPISLIVVEKEFLYEMAFRFAKE